MTENRVYLEDHLRRDEIPGRLAPLVVVRAVAEQQHVGRRSGASFTRAVGEHPAQELPDRQRPG